MGPSSLPAPVDSWGLPAQVQFGGGVQGTHLHAVVLVIHILEPGDELAGIEPISHGLVLIPLEKKSNMGICWRNKGEGKPAGRFKSSFLSEE